MSADHGSKLVGVGHAPPRTTMDFATHADAVSRALRRAARQARAPQSILSGGSVVRKSDRLLRIGLWASFVLIVLIPLVGASVYWSRIASDQYATETKFALRTGEGASLGNLGGLLGIALSQQAQDTQIVANYILSRSTVERLEQAGLFRPAYANAAADYFSRLKDDASIEEAEKFWRKHVDVSIETISGILTVNVRAFTSKDSLAIMQDVVSGAENLVNDLSSRARRDALEQAQAELKRSEARMQDATVALRDARNKLGVLDAGAAAEAISKLIGTLRVEYAKAEQDRNAQAGVSADAPQVRILNAKIASLKAQIDEYSKEIAGGSNDSMAVRLGSLSKLQVDLDLARQLYAQASLAYESARVDASTRTTYFASFMPPTPAQSSVYPKRWLQWSLIVGPCLAAWLALVSLAVVIRDNMAK